MSFTQLRSTTRNGQEVIIEDDRFMVAVRY
jgi:hypothetical protein